jgi:uncharacterized MAPEG superfamily protein
MLNMTIDLACLLVLALWSFVLNQMPVFGRMKKLGVAWGVSNREETPIVAPWIGRADRAQRNHHDNLPMLAIVILLAHMTGKHDGVTAVASVVMLVSRISHSLVYIWGITQLRPLFYLLSIVAMLAIVRRIVF